MQNPTQSPAAAAAAIPAAIPSAIPAGGKKQRVPGLDLVRCLAILCVLTTHAIAYTGIMDHITSPLYPLWLVVRFAGMTGVPLFLLLSGYLCCEKRGGAKYYTGILPVLISYVGVSAAVIIAMQITKLGDFTLWGAISGILNYTAHGYAWYVEMYIGLFLLIPFCNVLWAALDGAKARGTLILTLIGLTILPQTLMSFRVVGASLDILPDFWVGMYPLTYYFIGAWLKTYPPQMTRGKRFAAAVGAALLPAVLCGLYTWKDGAYAWYMMNGYQVITVLLAGVCFFVFLYDIRPKTKVFRVITEQVSLCSFEMYLCSYLTDQAMLRIEGMLGMERAGLRLVVHVAGSFVGAFLLGWVVHKISRALSAWLSSILLGKTKA